MYITEFRSSRGKSDHVLTTDVGLFDCTIPVYQYITTRAMITLQALHMLWSLSGVIMITHAWRDSHECSPCKCSLQPSKDLHGLLKHVDCSRRGLVRIPEILPIDLEFMDLSYNTIDSTTIQSVCDFHFLRVLSLAFNPFITLDGSEFLKCSVLVELNMTGNRLLHLKSGSFAGLSNLQKLYGLEAEFAEEGGFEHLVILETLEFTFLENSIPDEMFSGLPVKTLNLTLYRVKSVPQRLFEFGSKTLQFLRLFGPEVEFVHVDALRKLTMLKTVSLHLSKLVSLPDLFRQFGAATNSGGPRGLREVVLKGMESIPSQAFRHLDSVVTLCIHDVQNIAVSGLFDDLVNLEVLNLIGSSVVTVPSRWFALLHSLTSLNISNTTLRSLEVDSFQGLDNLTELDISLNVLRSLNPKTFDPLRSSIRTLHLRGNILKTIGDNLLKGMSTLEVLDLSDNKLTAISPHAFADLKLLSNLKLQENKLYYLSKGLFRNQQNLKILHLGANYFSRLPVAIKNTANSLRVLYLPDNKITTVPPYLQNVLPHLTYISLRKNPIYCQCRIFSLRLYLINLYINAICAAPRLYSSRHVMDIKIPEECPGPRPNPGQRPRSSSNLVPLLTTRDPYGHNRVDDTTYLHTTQNTHSLKEDSGMFERDISTGIEYTGTSHMSSVMKWNGKQYSLKPIARSTLAPIEPSFTTALPSGSTSSGIVTKPIPSDAMVRPEGYTADVVSSFLDENFRPSSSRHPPICGSRKDDQSEIEQNFSKPSGDDCEDGTKLPETPRGTVCCPDVVRTTLIYLGVTGVPILLTLLLIVLWWKKQGIRRRLYEVSPIELGNNTTLSRSNKG